MKILDLYIGKIIAYTTFLTLTVFIMLNSIIKFVEQMKSVGKGNYDIAHAALYVLYAIPQDMTLFFPMAALIGGLIGLGGLASNSELVVMQASGLSRLDIIKSVMRAAVILIVISMVIGEWIAPQGEAAARQLRAQAISGGNLISSNGGTWAKDGDYFVHIGEVQNRSLLKDVQIYRFTEQLTLASWVSAKNAYFHNEQWMLQDVVETQITAKKIKKHKQMLMPWQTSLTPDKLGVVTVKPESLSLSGLVDYLDYLAVNQQDQSRYLLAFWRKIAQPFTVAVMLLVALSFIFGPLRSVSMGARIMMGVATGILFFVVNEALGSMSLVFELPAILGAFLPSLLFVIGALMLIRRH